MVTATLINVEVVYASTTKQSLLALKVPENSSIREVIIASGILQHYPEIDLANLSVGIFSKKTSLDQIVKAGDRIELYRPLIIDPKEARKQRAQKSQD